MGGAFVLALPYTGWLASYTFSGPQARELAFRQGAVAVLALLLAFSFAAAGPASPPCGALVSARPERSGAFPRGADLARDQRHLLTQRIPADPFVPRRLGDLVLHARRESLSSPRSSSQVGDPPGKASLAAASSVWCVGSAIILARANDYAWLLWGETEVLALRHDSGHAARTEPRGEPGEVGPIRPNVESDATRAARERRRAARAPNIVIFSIDGLRTDHVGAYGYTKHPDHPEHRSLR